MAAMSDKKYEVKYSWEDIKFTIGFEDRNKQPIDAETKKFKFIYKDEADRKSTRLNSSHKHRSRMPSSA